MSDERRKPEDVALGTGLADLAKRLLMGRQRQVDDAVDSAVTGEVKPKPRKPKAAPKKKKKKSSTDKAAKNRARAITDLNSRIAAARAANNMDLVNTYEARKKALEGL